MFEKWHSDYALKKENDEVKILNDFHLWIGFNNYRGWKKTAPFPKIQKEKPVKQKKIKNTKKYEKPQDIP